MLLRISSGAKSRRVSQVPASRPTTSRPACVSGSTATPPVAPRPMTTTSVPLSLVAIAFAGPVVERCLRLVEHASVIRGSMRGRHGDAHLLLARRDGGAHAGIADQIPANEAGIAAVEGIAERALHGVAAYEREELRGAAA